MEGQDKHHGMSFASLSGKQVEATFDGGILTSDSGVTLLGEVEAKIGILYRIVEAITGSSASKLRASPDGGSGQTTCF